MQKERPASREQSTWLRSMAGQLYQALIDQKKEEYLADLHVHTIGDRSFDPQLYASVDTMAQAAMEMGLEIIAPTEHVMGEICSSTKVFYYLKRRYPELLTVPGLECAVCFSSTSISTPGQPTTTSEDHYPHLLVYSANPKVIENLFNLANQAYYNRPNRQEFRDFIKDNPALIVVAHPLKSGDRAKSSANPTIINKIALEIGDQLLGLELPKNGQQKQELAREIAARLKILILTNSDAHQPDQLGLTNYFSAHKIKTAREALNRLQEIKSSQTRHTDIKSVTSTYADC
ncbi:MAG: PHP domain-containing protein [Candidatus Pacebacteria bacterium]|nr:PHP domain-containing protein [Candidatus Paceibacterota bacterium]